MATDTLTIQNTTDYGQFKIMGGNRTIDRLHVDKLIAAMLENPDWFKTKPAVINEEGFIIDGQHRLEAAKTINYPFYYVIGDGMNLGAARAMNIRQKQWTFRDYADSYASGGNKNYENLLHMARNFPAIGLGALAEIAANHTGQRGDFTTSFKNGTYIIPDLSDALDRVEFFNEVIKASTRRMTSSFVSVMLQLLNRDDFEREHFLKRLEIGAELIPSQLARDNYRAIEDAYNYHMHEGSRVRLY